MIPSGNTNGIPIEWNMLWNIGLEGQPGAQIYIV
jgi:hypothetical protein